jgi:hypothetical protein
LRFLPALAMPDAPHRITHQLLQSSIVLRDALQGAAAAHQAPAIAANPAPPKTFMEAYPGMAAALWKVCGAGNDDNTLLMYWVTFTASGGKKQQSLALLESLVHEQALEPDSAQIHQIISNELFKEVYCIHLGSNDPKNLTYGLSPFLMCPRGYFKASLKRKKGNLYSTVHGEGFQASIQDIKELLTPGINIPGSVYQSVNLLVIQLNLANILMYIREWLT